MSRSHFEKISAHAGAIITLLAAIISLLVTISAPSIHAFDIVHVSFLANPEFDYNVIQARLGIWGYCLWMIPKNESFCADTGFGYPFFIYEFDGDGNLLAEHGVTEDWTWGLVVSGSATAFLIITTIVAFTKHQLIAALLSWWSGFVTFTFMTINLALYLKLRPQMRHFDGFESIGLGVGFWMSLAVLILTLVSGFVQLVKGRRASSGAGNGASSSFCVFRGGFLSRFWQK